jgi:putative transposase
MILEKAKKSYEKDKKSKVNKSTFNKYMKEAIAENRDFLKIYSQSRQDIFIRVQKAYQNFFRRLKEKNNGAKQKVGFPRFKSRDRYNSITYPQDNGAFSIEKNYLRISRIGRVQIELHRGIWGKIKTMTIKREAGKYYAIFTAIKDIEPPKVKNTNSVGIDMGLNSFVAISDGTLITKPKFVVERKKKLARWQKIAARRKKGSKRREKAKMKLQKEWEHITNQSDDYLHKLSHRLVNSGYTSFAIEKLNIQNMVKNHNLAGSIHNASWNRFTQLLSYKAESAGLKVIEVDPRNTSKTCSNCGYIMDNMPLSERAFSCWKCGMTKDRDINASINILKRATEGHSGSYVQGDDVRLQKGAIVEELKTYHATKSGIRVAREAHML